MSFAAMLCVLPTPLWAQSHTDERFASPVDTVDMLLEQAWQRDKIEPADMSDDSEFCRRVWLDLAGVAPPVWQLRKFLEDDSSDKRSELIDSLLESPRFAAHLATRWNDILLPVESEAEDRSNSAALQSWLRKQFLDNTPYDHLVGRFLTAGGKGDRGPAIFYTSRELDPVKLAGSTSRIFLGLQLECAQCHDHPTSRWTQEDFWSYAAFFAQLEPRDENTPNEQSIVDRPGREVTFPDSDRKMPPRYPGVEEPPEPDPMDFRRRQLTIWLASRNNPYFARAAANRVWSHLFGRGLVEPVDSMDKDNPASHPELLQFLADYLVESRFDLRVLYETLAKSKAYGLSSRLVGSDRPNPDAFAVMNVKTLTAAQYFDSLRQNVLAPPSDSIDPTGAAVDRMRQDFLTRMQARGVSALDYPHGVVQALGMMNGPEMLGATSKPNSRLLRAIEAPFLTDQQRIEAVFLACLSRYPSSTELEAFQKHLDESPENGLTDVTWVLLNTAECFVCP